MLIRFVFILFFWGAANEHGKGAGTGFNLNLPLERGTADDDYLVALDQALARISDFNPGAIVVALGLDAYVGDPFAGLALTTNGFRRVAEQIASLNLPTVLVQEGGYPCEQLGDNLAAVLSPFIHMSATP